MYTGAQGMQVQRALSQQDCRHSAEMCLKTMKTFIYFDSIVVISVVHLVVVFLTHIFRFTNFSFHYSPLSSLVALPQLVLHFALSTVHI